MPIVRLDKLDDAQPGEHNSDFIRDRTQAQADGMTDETDPRPAPT